MTTATLTPDSPTQAFQPLHFKRGSLEVVWSWTGEAWDGMWSPNRPTEDKLLRFTCYKEGKKMPGGTSVTRCPVSTPESKLEEFAHALLNAMENPPYSQTVAVVSWAGPKDKI